MSATPEFTRRERTGLLLAIVALAITLNSANYHFRLWLRDGVLHGLPFWADHLLTMVTLMVVVWGAIGLLLLGHATPYLVSEGVPTWLGGTTGLDFPTAARGLADFLTQHPDITLDTLMARYFPVAQYYPAGAVFVDMTFREGGTAAVKALFDAGVTPDAFRTSAERLYGKPWPAIAADWRAHALSFQRGPS